MLEVENERRVKRAEDRQKKYLDVAAADASPTQEQCGSSSWGAHLTEPQTIKVALSDERVELMGDWMLAVQDVHDFHVVGRLSLGADGSCALSATVSTDDEDGGAVMRCDGTWSTHEVGRLSECMAREWCRPVVTLRLLHGEEVGPAIAKLPIRLAHISSRLFGVPMADGPMEDDSAVPQLHMHISMHGREWRFFKHRRPLWQDRCALAGLDTSDRDRDGKSDLAVRLAHQARGFAQGGMESLAKRMWLGFWTALASCTHGCTAACCA